MQQNFDIAALERDREICIKQQELGQSVARLMTNRDFKKIILEGYFKDEAVRLVHLKQDPAVQSADSQRNIIRDMDSIGVLAAYLSMAISSGERAANTIEAIDAELIEIRAEALND